MGMTMERTLRAEIIRGSYVCGGIAADSLLALCRELVERGHDPATPLEAYRGTMLCLKVRSLGEGARLRVSPRGVGFVLERPGASPVADSFVPVVWDSPDQGKLTGKPLGRPLRLRSDGKQVRHDRHVDDQEY